MGLIFCSAIAFEEEKKTAGNVKGEEGGEVEVVEGELSDSGQEGEAVVGSKQE